MVLVRARVIGALLVHKESAVTAWIRPDGLEATIDAAFVAVRLPAALAYEVGTGT